MYLFINYFYIPNCLCVVYITKYKNESIFKNKLQEDLDIKPVAFLPVFAVGHHQVLGISWPEARDDRDSSTVCYG